MILVTLGTQDRSFKRLLEAIQKHHGALPADGRNGRGRKALRKPERRTCREHYGYADRNEPYSHEKEQS